MIFQDDENIKNLGLLHFWYRPRLFQEITVYYALLISQNYQMDVTNKTFYTKLTRYKKILCIFVFQNINLVVVIKIRQSKMT